MPVKVALFYVLMAVVWIGSSDQILTFVSQDPITLTCLQTYKGLLFVAVTTVLLFLIAYRQFRTITASSRQLRDSDLATTRLSRLYRMRSGINSAGARMASHDDFPGEVCRVAVQDADFTFCWIGMLDRRTLSVRATAWYGPCSSFLKKHRASASDAIPAGRERALSFGFRSVAAFPVVYDDKPIRVLVLYAMTAEALEG